MVVPEQAGPTRVDGIPSLPDSGPLRTLAVSGSISLFLFAAAVVATLRSAAPRQAEWPIGILTLALTTGLLGRLSNNAHALGVFLTLGTALAAAVQTRGTPRVLIALGTVAWMVAVWSARALFQ